MIGLDMKYFVLNPKSKKNNDQYAHASRMAMIAYAKHIINTNSMLANQLLNWVDKEGNKAVKLNNSET